MTKKNYEVIATALAASRPHAEWDANKMVQWELDVRNVAIVLQRDNLRFKRNYFEDACRNRPNQVDA